MARITILYSVIDGALSPRRWDSLMTLVPPEQGRRIERFMQWRDRHAALFGRLLLREGLMGLGFPGDCLKNLQATAFGRPFLPGVIDFNISHSHDWALCALAETGRVGIDVEHHRDIDLEDFHDQMTPSQIQTIASASDRRGAFFDLWTMKESVVKADGRGLSIPLAGIEAADGIAVADGRRWAVRRLEAAAGYSCHLATDQAAPLPSLTRIEL